MNQDPKKIVVVGATSAIAEHCARLWVAGAAAQLTLVARDVAKAERIAADLRVRNPAATIDVTTTSFVDPVAIAALAQSLSASRPPDIVLVAHGSLPDQARCEADIAACDDALIVNGVSPVLFAEAFANRMAPAGRGSLVLIGSVAGDRGRKSNYVYGAAKGMMERYAEGLQHRFAATGLRITLVKPGPTDTPMTAHLKAAGTSLADVADVAKRIVGAADAGRAVVYAPAKWRVIMTVIRLLPRAVFHRMNI